MSPDDYWRTLLALLVVLGLVLACAWAVRRFGGMARLGGRGPRRLAVVEILALDARRRLVLVRRDGIEHLLLLGPTHDLVIEAGRPAPGFAEHLPEPPP